MPERQHAERPKPPWSYAASQRERLRLRTGDRLRGEAARAQCALRDTREPAVEANRQAIEAAKERLAEASCLFDRAKATYSQAMARARKAALGPGAPSGRTEDEIPIGQASRRAPSALWNCFLSRDVADALGRIPELDGEGCATAGNVDGEGCQRWWDRRCGGSGSCCGCGCRCWCRSECWFGLSAGRRKPDPLSTMVSQRKGTGRMVLPTATARQTPETSHAKPTPVGVHRGRKTTASLARR